MKSNVAVMPGPAGATVEINAPEILQIIIRQDGAVVWVNVDGICRLRAAKVTKLLLEDGRRNHQRVLEEWKNEEGQGHAHAEARYNSVVLECPDMNDALWLKDMFLAHFRMASCVYYEDGVLSICYGEAGSGAQSLKEKIEAFCEGYFMGKEVRFPKFLHK